MRALMTATVPSMIGQFNMHNINILIELGYEVDVACNFNDYSVWSAEKIISLKKTLDELNVHMYQVDFTRRFFKIKQHTKSYKQIKKLINERKYDLIHTHTPISSLITRLAYKNSNIYESCKMIYTAHGFHFFKGNNPLKNFIFRSIEMMAAKYTDIIITINKEDYEAAKKFKLKNSGQVRYVPGVGVDIDKINKIKENRDQLIKDLALSNDDELIISIGELSKRKNHELVIKCLPQLPKNIHYLICGQGSLKEYLLQLADNLQVSEQVHLLGFKENAIEIIKSCNIFVFPSLQEGLPVAMMEAMACGLPCIASPIRGNRDLIDQPNGGYLIEFQDWEKTLKLVIKNINKNYKAMSIYNQKKISMYNTWKISASMKEIYQ